MCVCVCVLISSLVSKEVHLTSREMIILSLITDKVPLLQHKNQGRGVLLVWLKQAPPWEHNTEPPVLFMKMNLFLFTAEPGGQHDCVSLSLSLSLIMHHLKTRQLIFLQCLEGGPVLIQERRVTWNVPFSQLGEGVHGVQTLSLSCTDRHDVQTQCS